MGVEGLNANAADAANADDDVRQTYDVSGLGVTVMVDDGGRVPAGHTEFANAHGQSRVTNLAAASVSYSDHATHVAGTIGARGVRASAKGLAPDCSLVSVYYNDAASLSAAAPSGYASSVASHGVAVSNHSYGLSIGAYSRRLVGAKVLTWVENSAAFMTSQPDAAAARDEVRLYGKYSDKTAGVDAALRDVSRTTLSVWAAGNDRNQAFLAVGSYTFNGTPYTDPFLFGGPLADGASAAEVAAKMYSTSVAEGHRYFTYNSTNYYLPAAMGNSDSEMHDILSSLQVAKNSLVVGSVGLASGEGPIRSDPITATPLSQLSVFSSTGPTDDGRIKPELVADGFALESTISGGIVNAYATYTGTSMAAPVVTGCAALVNQMYRRVASKAAMPGALCKAVLIGGAYRGPPLGPATRRNVGPPNNATGYGLVDASKSLGFLRDWANDSSGNPKYVYLGEHAHAGGASKLTLDVYPRSTDVSTSVVVCWTDPPYTDVGRDATVVDASHSVVMNKLLVDCSEGIPGGLTYHPWYLNVNDPTAPARNAVASGSTDPVYGVEAPHDNTRVIEFLPCSTNRHVVELAAHEGAPFAGGAQDVAVLVEEAAYDAIPIVVTQNSTPSSSPHYIFTQNGTQTTTLVKGNAYRFIYPASESGHPFWIGSSGSSQSDLSGGAAIDSAPAGRSNEAGIVGGESLVLRIPSAYAEELHYYCTNQGHNMVGQFSLGDAPTAMSLHALEPPLSVASWVPSAVGDPYVYPRYGGGGTGFVKLPDVEATHVLFASARHGVTIRAHVGRATAEHQARMRAHVDQWEPDPATRRRAKCDGFFFHRISVEARGETLAVDLGIRGAECTRGAGGIRGAGGALSVFTSAPREGRPFTVQRRGPSEYRTAHFDEVSMETLEVSWSCVGANDGRTDAMVLRIMLFDNPHLENGLAFDSSHFGPTDEGAALSGEGLLVRAPDARGAPEAEAEVWHYARAVVGA